MTAYFGDFAEDATVYIPFNTFTSDDPAASATITNLADADIKVHKDGSVTQIVTDGATVAIDFDSITGNHLITVDTSAHADYAVGSDYMVRIEGTTVDGGTINAWVGSFSIENRFKEVNVTQVGGQTASATGAVDFDDLSTVEGLASGATGFAAIDTVVDTINGNVGTAGAGLTNIGTIATCTNLTNAPTNGDLTATMKTSVTTAATAATPTAAAVTGAVGSVTGSVASVTGAVGSVTGAVGSVAGNVVGSVGSVLGGIDTTGGTITTLDALDTAQDSQHATTQADTAAIVKSGFFTVENAITTVTSQTSFTLTSGPSNDLGEGIAIFFDATDSDNPSVVDITSYTGSTGVLLTDAAPGFTVTTSDSVTLAANAATSADVNVVQVGGQTATATGAVDFDDLATIEAVTTAQQADGTGLTEAGGTGDHLTAINLPNQTMDITGNLSGSVGSVTGAVGSVTGAVASVTGNVGGVAGTLNTLDDLDTAQDSQHSTTQGRLPAALVGGLMSSEVTSIGTSTTAATNLAASALGIVSGACEGTPSTTVIQTDLAEATDDHYIGRVVVFTSGAAAGQASDITDYTGSSGTITVTALTTAPLSSDTFVIV